MSRNGTTESPGVALVTGAAGTIGPAICQALREAGWKVAAAGRTLPSFAQAEALRGGPYPADVQLEADLTRRDECFRLVERAVAALGPVTLLVNNATGNTGQPASFGQASEEYCRQVFAVDVLAAIYLSQAALPSLQAGRGQIINVGTVMTEQFERGAAVYSAAKAALETLTRSLAYEFLSDGVRVNCLRVGWVPGTSFVRPHLPKVDPAVWPELLRDTLAEHLEQSRASLPCGEPEDIAAAIAFLASPAAAFINGVVLPVDGGYGLGMLGLAAEKLAAPSRGAEPSVAERWKSDPAAAYEDWKRSRATPR